MATPAPAPAPMNRRVRAGRALLAAAVIVATVAWAFGGDDVATDNAYVRGDVTSLAPKVGGYVTVVHVADNQAVRAGDVLFRIDDRDHRARLAQAEAGVEAARARLVNVDAETALQRAVVRQAEAQRRAQLAELGLATKLADRRRELAERDFVSRIQVDESDAARARAEAGVAAAAATVDAQAERIAVLATQREAALAAVAQAQALRDLAKIDLDGTVVRAPVDGVVGNRQVRVGRLVAPGVPLLDIVPVDDLWIVANFKETQLAHVRPGQAVRITIDGVPDAAFAGVVDSAAPGSGAAFALLPADNATGNFVRVVQRVPVKIRFADGTLPDGVVPGLSARVEIAPARGP